MGINTQGQNKSAAGLSTYMSPYGAWALALGNSIGWGSLVVTTNTYLAQAGVLGSTLGVIAGMLIMFVVAMNYHRMMQGYSNSGGIYGYTRDLFGYDHGVLVAWFLILVYIAMFWANATSIPLFARNFFGNLFQFGVHYHVFDYDVYLGEVLLSTTFILLAGFVCTLRKRGVQWALIVMACVIAVGILACFAVAMSSRIAEGVSFKPLFIPDKNPIVQTINIACISSWAFIGFESISHSSAEFNFPLKKSMRVLMISLVTITAIYVFVTLLSVSAFPEQYATWLDYVKDLPNQTGLASIPAFYAADHYLGAAGVCVLAAVLLCLIFTSLIGNLISLSRLVFSLANDGVVYGKLAHINENGVPSNAVWIIALVSTVIPLLGRTAIGWIVDVTTLGATIVYGFVSACAFRDGRMRKDATETYCGALGLLLMVSFAMYLLLPSLSASANMASESYFLFAVWAMLGFLYFRRLLSTDEHRRFGRSVITWVALLGLVIFTSLAWMDQTIDRITLESLEDVRGTLIQPAATQADGGQSLIAQTSKGLSSTITGYMFAVSSMFMFSLVVMLSNFTVMMHREEESHKQAKAAHNVANTDPLTGVGSKHAYVARESELNRALVAGELLELAVVVCDVNGLKTVNDTLGHKAGDEYIRSASKLICSMYRNSQVYRIGGDEFVVLLQDEDYLHRDAILAQLDRTVEANRDRGEVVVACGMSCLTPQMDHEVHAVFERADAFMYNRKRELKRPGEEIR